MSQSLDNSTPFGWEAKPPAEASDNKLEFSTSAGDSDPLVYNGNDNQEDFSQDSSGVPSDGGASTKSDMDLMLEGNMFPRQKGHDSLSGDEVIFS